MILPMVLRAAVCTFACVVSLNILMIVGNTPVFTTSVIFSFGPSVKYDNAQRASVRISVYGEKEKRGGEVPTSVEERDWMRVGTHGRTWSKLGCGLPLRIISME